MKATTSLWIPDRIGSRPTRSAATLALSALLLAGCGTPTPDKNAASLAKHWLRARPLTLDRAELPLAEGMAIQRALVQRLKSQRGAIVGYKVALTSETAQQQFGVDHPLRGTLLAGMLYQGNTALSVFSGARLVVEADLVVRVGRTGLHLADTPRDCLAHLEAVYPFLEVPDLLFKPGTPLQAGHLAAINAGARFGVLGEPVRIENTDAWADRLGAISVQLTDGEGTEIAAGNSSALLGHPLAAVHWLARSLYEDGIALHPGDLLSLGSMTPLQPAVEGTTFRAVYDNLSPDVPVEISVSF